MVVMEDRFTEATEPMVSMIEHEEASGIGTVRHMPREQTLSRLCRDCERLWMRSRNGKEDPGILEMIHDGPTFWTPSSLRSMCP